MGVLLIIRAQDFGHPVGKGQAVVDGGEVVVHYRHEGQQAVEHKDECEQPGYRGQIAPHPQIADEQKGRHPHNRQHLIDGRDGGVAHAALAAGLHAVHHNRLDSLQHIFLAAKGMHQPDALQILQNVGVEGDAGVHKTLGEGAQFAVDAAQGIHQQQERAHRGQSHRPGEPEQHAHIGRHQQAVGQQFVDADEHIAHPHNLLHIADQIAHFVAADLGVAD